ncbi:MAG: universal stress protein [Chloroflexi bacterium]|nr:universal stress protein [Chloroflexota bacterium]
MAPTSLSRVSSILVPVDGSSASHQAIAVAADIAKRNRAEIHLLYVIEMPRSMALDATVEGELQHAETILERAEAVAESLGVTVTGDLVQARQAGHAIVDEARERAVDIVIIGVEYDEPYGRFELGSTPRYVLEHAAAQVWVIRAAEPTAT